MPTGLFILIFSQLIGEGLHQLLHLPVPGPVIGMLLLALAIAAWPKALPLSASEEGRSLDATSGLLIRNMGLLFIPAGAGIVAEAPVLSHAWLPLLVALIVSTFLTLIVTGAAMNWMENRARKKAASPTAKGGNSL